MLAPAGSRAGQTHFGHSSFSMEPALTVSTVTSMLRLLPSPELIESICSAQKSPIQDSITQSYLGFESGLLTAMQKCCCYGHFWENAGTTLGWSVNAVTTIYIAGGSDSLKANRNVTIWKATRPTPGHHSARYYP